MTPADDVSVATAAAFPSANAADTSATAPGGPSLSVGGVSDMRHGKPVNTTTAVASRNAAAARGSCVRHRRGNGVGGASHA